MHSYRDLPLRYAELGLVHRHELSGALHGLFRVRAFTQDDAHVFMLPEQMQSELMKVIELFDRIYSQFGLKYHVELSTKPDNAMGDDAIWEAATEALRNAIEQKAIDYVINLATAHSTALNLTTISKIPWAVHGNVVLSNWI